jgi:solute carrier family 25 (mitochondrial phosphate transporter), member 23/24/25/41
MAPSKSVGDAEKAPTGVLGVEETEDPRAPAAEATANPNAPAAPTAPASEQADDDDNELAVRLPPGLDSGDIVLFNRRCMSMPPAGAALCALAKGMSNSNWDHVGIVVRDPASGELLFLEADFGGVKLRSLKERVRRSKSHEIAVRRLSIVRTESMRQKLYSFASNMLGRPYEIGTGSVMARVADPVAKNERERLHALLIDKRATVREIDKELASAAATTTARRVLTVERARIAKVIDQIESKLFKEFGGRTSVISDAKADLSRVFCSELVAAAYQDLGLLDRYPLANSYNPKDFSSEQTNPPGVHLLRGSRLSAEIPLRRAPARNVLVDAFRSLICGEISSSPSSTKPKRNMIDDGSGDGSSGKRKRTRGPATVRGVAEGDTPSRDSRRLIRDVLKRTPVYSKVPDEYKWSHLTKSFIARVVEPGDVVFSQGDYEDKLYVIESGAVDRFMTKGENEDPVLVNSLGSRNTFGITGFTFNCPRATTIRASERTLLWMVDRPTFELFKDTSNAVQDIVSDADQRALRGLLKGHFLFNRLDKLGPMELNEFFVVKFRAGETLFKQGDSGDNFYIIKSGEVERHIRHPRRGERNGDVVQDEVEHLSLAKTLRPGQSFGELSLMYNAPRAATVRARTDTECWAISAESFHRLNLGQGTQYLRAIFQRFASVEKDGTSYMTSDDLLQFADVAAFQDQACRERLSKLLVSLVTSNRERDPMRRRSKLAFHDSSARGGFNGNGGNGGAAIVDPQSEGEDGDEEHDDDADDVLMDFWEFVRFDLVLNQPAAELDFAFRLADQNNSGFISLDEMQCLLQDYADIDPVARDMLSGKNKLLLKVFGRDGSRGLSAKEFQKLSKDILPPTFLEDIQHLTHHMLNMDPAANVTGMMMLDAELEELAFVEPDGSPSVLGSQFVGSATRSGGRRRQREWRKEIQLELQDQLHNKGLEGGSGGNGGINLERMRTVGVSGSVDETPHGIFEANKNSLLSSHGSIKASSGRLAEALSLYSGEMPWAHLLSVGVSGTASRTFVAPLERLKILMQTQSISGRDGGKQYVGIASGMSKMVRDDTSMWRALFRGNGANVLRIVPNAAIQLAVVDQLHRIAGRRGAMNSARSGSIDSLSQREAAARAKAVEAVVIGGIAGMSAAAATYPLDYIRGRLTLQSRGFERYRGTVHGLRTSMAEEGVLSIYRGLTPTLLGVFPYVGLSFGMYEMLRPLLPRQNDGSGRPTVVSAIIGGALASGTGQIAAYPLDTVRRRMQVAGFAPGCEIGEVNGVGGTARAILGIAKKEGIRGLFRGLAPNLAKVLPASSVSFIVYEQIRGSWDR